MSWSVDAPDGRLGVDIVLAGGSLRYRIALVGKAVVEGDLGVELGDGSLSTGLTFGHESTTRVTSSFSLPHGKARRATSEASELQAVFHGAAGHRLVVVVRAYDDGVAIRYVVDGDGDLTIVSEATTFEFPSGGQAWIQPTDKPGYTAPAYEAVHRRGLPIGEDDDVPSWNLPALFETAETFVLLTESDTDETYFGGHLRPLSDRTGYGWVGPQAAEGEGLGSIQTSQPGPWSLPWRVVAIGDLGSIATTDLVRHLARPGLAAAEWIRPGRVSWSWWSDHDSPQNLQSLRTFVDLAVEMGWEYTLIDANWQIHAETAFRALLDHAASRGIGVFLWYNSGGPNNVVTEQPRDKMFDADVRRAEFAKLAEWGVVGVKVDFWHSDKAESNGRYLALAADAYDAGLMVNYHGCTIPRGWEVRYPHVMTMEGVRGAEQYSFDPNFTDDAPWLNTVLPFTRNVVGSMDYTPVTFSDMAYPHSTTNAHELALAVVFESALGHFADSATSYLAQSADVRRFLRDVPVVWDETRLLAGYPGTHAVFARRLGPDWWIGGINGTDDPVELVLDFDGMGGQGELFAEREGEARSIEVRSIELSGAFPIAMSPRGGFAIRPATDEDIA